MSLVTLYVLVIDSSKTEYNRLPSVICRREVRVSRKRVDVACLTPVCNGVRILYIIGYNGLEYPRPACDPRT
jgi:hypothetical protein